MIAVADCTGHSVPGAFLSILGISFLNETFFSSESAHPDEILNKLNFKKNHNKLKMWKEYIGKISRLNRSVKIGIVGKYFDIGTSQLSDSYISVIEAVKHASWNNNLKPDISWINSKIFEKKPEELSTLNLLDGIIVPVGFGHSGIEGKISAIRYCRENGIPYLGLCLGMLDYK